MEMPAIEPGMGNGVQLYSTSVRRIEDNEIYINKSGRDPLEEVIAAIVNQEAFGDNSRLNAVMFKGLPGTGKGYTLQWIRTKVSDTMGQEIPLLQVGSIQTPEDVMQLYADARKIAKEKGRCLIWDDEVDKRGKRGEIQDSQKEAVLNQFLIEMDGGANNQGVYTLCCTNRPDKIDPAYRRGKRCGKEITFDPLDKEGREFISRVEAFVRNHQFIFNAEDLAGIVGKTYGAVGADISQLFVDTTTYANLQLTRGLEAVAEKILFGEGANVESLVPDLETLGMANLPQSYENYLKHFLGRKSDFFKEAKDIAEDDEYRKKKLGERFAREMFSYLNPNENPSGTGGKTDPLDVSKDDGSKKKVVRWITVNQKHIDHVLEHFVPSALKDMPFEETELTFSSFGGLDAQVNYLRRIVENTILDPDKDGTTVYLYGKQGCGVTSLARAVAGEYGFNLVVLYGSDQESKWWGEVKDRLLEINDRAKASKPTIVVLDNVHYLAHNSGSLETSLKQTATSALKQIIKPTPGVIYIATGDHPDQLDESVRSLFLRKIPVTPPTEDDHYTRIWSNCLGLSAAVEGEEIDFTSLAVHSKGLYGGDIKNICRCFVELGVPYTQKALERVLKRYQEGVAQGGADHLKIMDDMTLANLVLQGLR